MTALFPTYTSLWQRAKRFLATDITPLWERFLEACEVDEQRYINESRAKGLDDFDCFGFSSFR
ncbi:MAG TPA: hypothetical protein V6D26_26380 [Stenomitos sp.]